MWTTVMRRCPVILVICVAMNMVSASAWAEGERPSDNRPPDNRNALSMAGMTNDPRAGIKLVPMSDHCNELWQKALKAGFLNASRPGVVYNESGNYLRSEAFISWNKVEQRLEIDCIFTSDDLDVDLKDLIDSRE